MFLDSTNYLPILKKLIGEATSIDMAVAFWGDGAERLLLGLGKPTRIVCNLTSGGTNPSVIEALQNDGIEVRHLSDLHAKVVLGSGTVVLGSANCSANGLSLEGDEANGWQEAGYLITSALEITRIQDWFVQLWSSAEEITPDLLERARQIWQRRRKTRVLSGANRQTLLSMSPSSLRGRNIVVAIYREKTSAEAAKVVDERKLAENDSNLTRAWTFYEDWSVKDLKKGMVVIDVYIGPRGGVLVRGPYKIFEVTKSRRKEGEWKGEMMTIHYASSADNLVGLPAKTVLAGLKERVAPKAFELLPIGAESKVIPVEKLVTMI